MPYLKHLGHPPGEYEGETWPEEPHVIVPDVLNAMAYGTAHHRHMNLICKLYNRWCKRPGKVATITIFDSSYLVIQID